MAASELGIDDQQCKLISKALADPKRFEMLQKLSEPGPSPTCTYMCEALGICAATVSHHIKELLNAGLVKVEREGKFARISLRRDVWSAYLKRLSLI